MNKLKFECLNQKDLDRLSLSDEDLDLLDRFLKTKLQTNLNNMRVYKTRLLQFFEIEQKPLLKITENEIDDFFGIIDKRDLKIATKRLIRHILKAFFEDIEKKLRRIDPTYFNPVGKHKFTPDETLSDKEQKRKNANQTFTILELKEILKLAYFTSRDAQKESSKCMFCIILLDMFTGARISEIVSIKRENLNLEERYFRTGIELGARKSNHDGGNELYFCFPSAIAVILGEYLKEHIDSIWLFPGLKTNTHIHRITPYCFIQKLNVSFTEKMRTHVFRHSLCTFMKNINNKVDLTDIEVLTNHVPSSPVMKNYVYESIDERREKYDQSLPKEYSELLDFLRQL